MALKHSKKAQGFLNSLPFDVLERFYDYSDGSKILIVSDAEFDDIASVFGAGMEYTAKNGNNAYYAYMPTKVTAGEIQVIFVFKNEDDIEKTANAIVDDHPWDEK